MFDIFGPHPNQKQALLSKFELVYDIKKDKFKQYDITALSKAGKVDLLVADHGHLDACNGVFSATPEFPDGIYHYHATMPVEGEILQRTTHFPISSTVMQGLLKAPTLTEEEMEVCQDHLMLTMMVLEMDGICV